MAATGSNLDSLLTSLHRRGTVLHVAEAGGIGLLVGACSALFSTLLLWHYGRPVMNPALIALVGGGLAGLSWGIWRRPSALRFAVRADRQLQTDDLLATAVALAGASHYPGRSSWDDAVLVMAEQRSRNLSASSVTLHRFGPRAWGGIMLSSAIAVIIAMLAGAGVQAQAESKDVRRAGMNRENRPPSRPLIVLAPDSPLLRQTAIERPDVGDSTTAEQHEKSAFKPATQPAVAAADANDSTATQSEDGTGGGTSQINRSPADSSAATPSIAQRNSVTKPTPNLTVGRPAGGAGDTGADPANDVYRPPISQGQSNNRHATGAAPWQSEHWAKDVQSAREQLQSGQLPPAHRDLIRSYFSVE